MIKTSKHIATCLLCCSIAAAPIALTGCEDMFETDSDRQIFDPELDQLTDSMFYTLGIMKGLQMAADQYVMQGEMRGDLVATNQYTETDLRELANFSATTANKYDSAYVYYRVINNCNYYIAHRDTTLRVGSRQVALPEYAEALAVRAWAYMQLCKTYGTVPFFTEPLVNIGDANSQKETKDLQGICDALAPELIRFSGTPVPDYGSVSAGVLNSSDSDNPQEKSVNSKLAMLPVDVVLGDLFLETHQYDQAAKYYFNYLRTNELTLGQTFINIDSYLLQILEDKIPSSLTSMNSEGFSWSSIFSVNGNNDIVTYIPLAANKLRGVVTELPGIFGYDFYSTTGGAAGSNARYLLERQIDASPGYVALSDAQDYYYTSGAGTGGSTVVSKADIGDLRRYITMRQVAKNDSAFAVMIKFTSANVPIYRAATVYLRLAESLNRMGYPDAAFAILKDGINEDLTTYVQHGDSTDLEANRYIRPQTAQLLQTAIPFLSPENTQTFVDNWGIHSRGCNYTQGSFSPYQYQTIVANKMAELQQQGITATGTLNDTINAVEDLICDEMALELAFEGNRFGDLTRIARHKNNAALYGANYGSQWLARKLAYKHPVVDLLDKNNWYLPFK
ncbi:MAG: RagB/SusD family nutrient uptake outer membrane protein [Prevotella sp.]|nr:RagB/SusD family nutrient uptake outer membrane protein [Prevotella sp.]